MGACNIDHSLADVKKKLNDQQSFLPHDLFTDGQDFLQKDQTQETLNTFFHLLKKYDLATEDEQQDRNQKLAALVNS